MGIIEELRLKKNKSRQELAEEVGVTRQSIHNWEIKKRTPSLKKMEKLSKILGVSINKITKDYLNK